jgi:catechol 2,3-dioxygenase-like lactoylglutathione lyase family enzyme
MQLRHLILYVSDLAAARAFYEGAVGLGVLEEDETSVKYAAGQVTVCLERAADAGVELAEGRDRSVDITFLVDDLEATRAVLEGHGVRVSKTLDYAVGKTADFYDPDGHWFSLYEPSEAALTWPSGDKLRELAPAGDLPLVYLFLFVQDLDGTEEFYNRVLGLEAIEGGPCKRGVTRLPAGVVKYDAGATLLTTHFVDDDHAAEHRVSTQGSGGAVMVFETGDVRGTMAALADRGVAFPDGVTAERLGTVARFRDPSGHVYFLCEPAVQRVPA